MSDWSRRRALHALATGTAVALAGCNDERGASREVAPGATRGTELTEYTSLKVRERGVELLFWEGDRPDDEQAAHRGRVYVTSADDVSSLTFAAESEAGAELEAFVRSTDLETRSVSLDATTIPACDELRLRRVLREPDGYTTSFCTAPRPADVECEADAEATVAVAIRLPFPGDEVSTLGSSWSRRCRDDPRPVTPSNEMEVDGDV